MTDNIPPRPWRVEQKNHTCDVLDAKGRPVISHVDPWFAALIVRLVNAEAQVVETLLRSRDALNDYGGSYGNADDNAVREARANVEVALALLRGDRPGEGGES